MIILTMYLDVKNFISGDGEFLPMFSKNINFPKAEEEVIEFWEKNDSFKQSLEDSKSKPKFMFLDGPPFATGLPHYGHILSGSIKDTVGRFWTQQGFHVERRFGWDCHGLPVEYEIDKQLKITDRQQVLDMGIGKYNEECRAIVMKYSSQWEKTVTRMGRWVDFKNGYKTMDKSFMESVWFIFKQLWNRNLIYRGYQVMPFSTACKTPLSNFEANLNYTDVSDPSVLIAFPLKKPLKGHEVSLVAWTTTPWTLPSNCGLFVNEAFKYDIFEYKGKIYAVHTDRVKEYFKDYKVVDSVMGSELVGLEYNQPFDFFEEYRSKGFFRVVPAEFVSCTNGTAIVHCAPGFGEEDYKAFVACGLIKHNDAVPCPVDENGKFTLGKYEGIYVKDLDKIILKDIADRVLLNNRIVHSYPFCWRSDTPLIYKLVANWFIRVGEHHDELLKCNEEIYWFPEDIKYKRFHNWLAQSRDWSISRNRFWGTPLPVWVTEDYSDMICVGSVTELEELSGVRVEDLHRQFVDGIVIEKDGKTYRRIDEVLDCWFESGSVPYAQSHWPFECSDIGGKISDMQLKTNNGYLSKDGLPVNFIAEGLDQTRGWFYTLHVISTLLFNKPAFQNVIVNGIVLAEDGKKMSKRLKNYPDPGYVFDKYGSDALRMYLFSSPVVEANNLKFSENGIKEILKVLLIPWYNSLTFLMESGENDCKIEMDSWILSSFNNFCCNVRESMDKYMLNPILGFAISFIDDLSNWYIRINRKALRGGSKLFRNIMKEFSIVMAPFTPFFAEYCYQSLKGFDPSGPVSVHQSMYPSTKRSEHPFNRVKLVVEAVRQMRERLRLKLKRPLKSVTVVCSSDLQDLLEGYAEVIQTECNVLELLFEREDKFEFSVTVKPFFENLKKDPSTFKKKLDIINGMSQEQVSNIQNQTLEVDDLLITKSDLLVVKEFSDVDNSCVCEGFGVILDVEINESIVEMADARCFYSFIQRLRKSLGLTANDNASVSVDSDYLKNVTVSVYSDVVFGSEGKFLGDAEYPFNEENIKVELYLMN